MGGMPIFVLMDLSQIPDFVKLALFIFFCVVIAIQLFYYLFIL